MEKEIHKNIEHEIGIIEAFLKDEIFTIEKNNFPISDCEIKLTKDVEQTQINFELKLNEALLPNQITFKKTWV